MKNKEKNFISAIIYIYNNQNILEKNIKKIYDTLNSNFEKFEIICINDDSSDDSNKNIKKYAEKNKAAVINVINMSFHQGLEASMHAGIDLSIGDFVFEFDNIEHDINESIVMDIYNKSLKGYDIVSAAPSKLNLISKIFYKIFNKFSYVQNSLGTEIVRVISRRAINRIHDLSKTIPYRKALYANCGLKVDIIKYDQLKPSKKLKKENIKIATNSLILFTDITYKITIVITLIMMLLSIFVGIYTITTYLSSEPVIGWTTTMLFLSLSFFGLFLILSIIIKYLSIILDMIFKKQNYLIESIEKVNKA
jgi:polyisoprenyl-phosphate glycosyltransferase